MGTEESTGNLAVVWAGPRQLDLQPRPIPTPGPGEVLIKVISTGICGSDLHNYHATSLTHPVVLGHESAGVVVQLGPPQKQPSDDPSSPSFTTQQLPPTPAVGTRVAIEPGAPCARCASCLRGNPNTCAALRYAGLDPTDGTLCRWYVCAAERAVPVPESVSWAEAGCVQPLAVAVQLARRAALGPHQTLAIFGCGPLGLLTLAIAKAYGVRKTVVFDIEPARVDFARTHVGADVGLVVEPTQFLSPAAPGSSSISSDQPPPPTNNNNNTTSFDRVRDYAAALVAEHGLGQGFDVAVEASGAEVCSQLAVCVLRAGGTCIQAGLGKPLTAVPLYLLTAKELNIKGTVRYTPGCFEDAISLLSRKMIDLKPLITSTYPLTEAARAFEAQDARKDIKIVIMNQG